MRWAGRAAIARMAMAVMAVAQMVGCSDAGTTAIDPAAIESRPLTVAGSEARTLFERLAPSETGIDFINRIATDHPLKRLYHAGFAAGGVALGDVDGDARPDIFLVGGPGENRLYLQTSPWRFRDVTAERSVGGHGLDGADRWGAGVAMADVDNDGDLDIYVCNYDAPNHLFINDGGGRFVERAAAFGLDITDASLAPYFCDYDRDGHLDLYLLTYVFYREGGRPARIHPRWAGDRPVMPAELARYYRFERGPGGWVFDEVGRPDRLLRHDGDPVQPRFVEVTVQAGISNQPGLGNSATWWDYDHDGWPDLYVGNDLRDPDHLYRNNGDGTFTDVIVEAVPHTTWYSMGAAAGDVNNDGRLDLFIADMAPTTHYMQKTTMGSMATFARFLDTEVPRQYMRNSLFLNTGTEQFMEIAYLAGIARTDWTWAVKFGDFDCDGRLDLFLSNGIARNFNNADLLPAVGPTLVGRTEWDLRESTPARPERNLAYQNQGDFEFLPVGDGWGLDHLGMSYAAAQGDLDLDGDLDLVVVNLDEPVTLYRNTLSGSHRLLLSLRGTASNRFGVGAMVEIQTSAGRQVRQMIPQTGFASSNVPLVHFGLGEDAVIRRLRINWPSGHRQTFHKLAADRFYTIREPDSPAAPPPPQTDRPDPMFTRRQQPSFRHRERAYDDYRRQPLLPRKMSQLGPGIAVGDIDSDGDEDLYIGGAAGQLGRLFRNLGEGRWQGTAIIDDPSQEQMAALLFEADGDGDLDLYVVGGGVEFEPPDEGLRDRLYLNDGRGAFTPAAEDALPAATDSGSTVAAADFDRDGDLDLFVGGRVIPGLYPVTPTSRLLRNEGGRFQDVTSDLARGLQETGLVTSALWSDADGDGWLDLLLTHEWGPVKLWHNRQGRLVDATRQADLADRLGWFNGIAGRDLDGDGDIDYVVTNFGLNTRYRASFQSPVLLYYGDFEGSGKVRLVEAEYEGSMLYPVRGRSCSTSAMPSLGEKFLSYHAFAAASLEQLYTPAGLDRAKVYRANTLESGVLLNDGAGRFVFRPLPRLAQAAPGFGVVLTEVNGDEHADLYLVQNFFSSQRETGRMDGGMSLLLTGRGDGTFDPVWPETSGLVVAADAKAVVVADLTGTGAIDLLVTVNDGELAAFRHNEQGAARRLTIRLRGRRGNPTAIGARVTVELDNLTRQTAEVAAGGSYLGQSTPALVFGLGHEYSVRRVEVRWPDGRTTTETVSPGSRSITIQQPHAE